MSSDSRKWKINDFQVEMILFNNVSLDEWMGLITNIKNDIGLKEAIVIALLANKEWQLIGSMSLVYKYINDIRSTGWIQTQNITILYKCLFHIWW